MTGNPPAFPSPAERCPITGEGIMEGTPGLSTRDYFAGQALAAMLLDEAADPTPETLAARCYGIADAFLIERAKAVAA